MLHTGDPTVFQVGHGGAGGASYSHAVQTCPTVIGLQVGQVGQNTDTILSLPHLPHRDRAAGGAGFPFAAVGCPTCPTLPHLKNDRVNENTHKNAGVLSMPLPTPAEIAAILQAFHRASRPETPCVDGHHSWVTCCADHPGILQCQDCPAVYVSPHGKQPHA
jgi:hypothetical protein